MGIVWNKISNTEKVEALMVFAGRHFHMHQQVATGIREYLTQLHGIADVITGCFLKDLHTVSDCADYMESTMRHQFQKEHEHYEPETKQERKRKRSRS